MIYIDKKKAKDYEKYGFTEFQKEIKLTKYALLDEKQSLNKYESSFEIVDVNKDFYLGKLCKNNDKTLALMYELIQDKIIYKIDDKNVVEFMEEQRQNEASR